MSWKRFEAISEISLPSRKRTKQFVKTFKIFLALFFFFKLCSSKVFNLLSYYLMADSNYNISFGDPYYQSVDYRTRHPAYLKRIVSPPKWAVNVEDLYPKKFGLRKRKEFQFTNHRVEDKLCSGRLDLQEAAVVVGTKIVVKNPPNTVINRSETLGSMSMGKLKGIYYYCNYAR